MDCILDQSGPYIQLVHTHIRSMVAVVHTQTCIFLYILYRV